MTIGCLLFGSAWVSALLNRKNHQLSATDNSADIAQPVTAAPTVAEASPEPVAIEPAVVEPTVIAPPTPITYLVVDVVDGDTLKITDNGSLVTIRVIGIDTPETVDPRQPVQCYGKEASDQAKTLLAGKQVSLTADPTQDDKDKYNRLLRYISLEDGVDYGLAMITNGYAHEYTYNVPYERQTTYKQAEKEASAAAKGLWAATTCNGETSTAAIVPKTTTTPPVNEPKTTPPKTDTTGQVDKDCPDFASHAEAQAYFEARGGSPSNNVDRLDADHDGLACESLK